MITHTITKTWQGSNSLSLTKSVSFQASEELNFDFSLAANTTNQQVNLAFTKADLQSIFISSDQDITIKTNSSGSPQDTLTITAGNPFEWDATSGIANPFAGSVTTAYFTNGTSTNANVSVRTLTNG